MEPQILQGLDLVSFNTAESHSLAVAPGIYHRNPLSGAQKLFKIVDNVHEYKQLHLEVPEDVLQPLTGCKVWNPVTKTYMTGNTITNAYYEVMEEMCPDEFLAKCLHNISSKEADVKGVMLNSTQPISAITAAVIVGLQTAIASSAYKIAMFGDTNFGTAQYHSQAKVNLMAGRSTEQKDRMVTMLSKDEGIWSMLRRMAGNSEINFVSTNDGTVAGNATSSTNIKDFLVSMIHNSSDVLRYWDHYVPGNKPAFYLQGALFRALIDYYESLPGGSDAYLLTLNGTPVPGAYMFEGYPVFHAVDWDIFDNSIGLKNPGTAQSWNQRALFTVAQNLTLTTNIRRSGPFEGGLTIQPSPLVRDKGRVDMHMVMGIGSGIARPELTTVGFNTSYTYA